MADLPWLRLYTDMVDNEKIRLLAFEDRWHFVAILCIKQQGILEDKGTLRDRKIAVKLGLQLVDLGEVKRRLLEVGLIDEDWNPIGWDKRQFKSDSSTERVRKYRENKGKSKSNANETFQERSCNVIDTESYADNILPNGNKSAKHADTRKTCQHQKVIDLYHDKLKACPSVKEWNSSRQGYLRSRWNEKEERQDIDWWGRFFDYISKSDFLMGRTEGKDGKPPFVADLEWIIRPTNFAKIIEGKYHR